MAEQYEKCTIRALAPVSLFDTMQGQDKVINNIPSYRGNYLILHDHMEVFIVTRWCISVDVVLLMAIGPITPASLHALLSASE